MAIVTHITPNDFTRIQYLSKIGNTLNFALNFSFDTNNKCTVLSKLVISNGNFPTEIPVLLIEIVEDVNGSTTIQVVENVDVTMDNIDAPVSILAKVNENGNERTSKIYSEEAGQHQR